MANSPSYTATPISRSVILDTSNLNLDGTGAIALLYTVPSSGMLVEAITLKGLETSTAGLIRLFKKQDDGVFYLLSEITIDAVTPSATVSTLEKKVIYNEYPFVFEGGDEIYVSTTNNQKIIVTLLGGIF